jgi:hypothetical protein
MKRLAVLVLLAACSKESEMLPIDPGGGGTGTGSGFRPDASMPGGDASPFITGRVCYVANDLRAFNGCATTGAAEFTVQLGTDMVQTAADGTFTMMRPAITTGLTWIVSRDDTVTSRIKFGGTTTLPALDAIAYDQMLQATNVAIANNSGGMMVRVTRTGAPVVGATVAAQPVPDAGPFYDGPSELEWELDSTGAFGVAWLPSTPVGTSQLTITSGMMNTTVTGHSVAADALTFVFAEIP